MSYNSLKTWRTVVPFAEIKAQLPKRTATSNSWDRRQFLQHPSKNIAGTEIKQEIAAFWLEHCECSPNKKDVLMKHSTTPGHHVRQKGNDGRTHRLCSPNATCTSAMKHFVDGSDAQLFRLFLDTHPHRKGGLVLKN